MLRKAITPSELVHFGLGEHVQVISSIEVVVVAQRSANTLVPNEMSLFGGRRKNSAQTKFGFNTLSFDWHDVKLEEECVCLGRCHLVRVRDDGANLEVHTRLATLGFVRVHRVQHFALESHEIANVHGKLEINVAHLDKHWMTTGE